jgi:hypothetical protein
VMPDARESRLIGTSGNTKPGETYADSSILVSIGDRYEGIDGILLRRGVGWRHDEFSEVRVLVIWIPPPKNRK